MGEIADQLIKDNINGIDQKEIKKYYIVWAGHKPGVYSVWSECEAQVKDFKGARYKSFTCDYAEADRLFRYFNFATKKKDKKEVTPVNNSPKSPKGYILNSLAVDAACSMNPGPVEYKGVNVKTGKVVFKQGPYSGGTNNIGEFLAIVHALALLNKHGSKAPIYSDSQTAITWIKNKKANTQMVQNNQNKKLFELLYRAEKWLRENKYQNQILKWETKLWNEIPADFGNKK